MLYELVNEELAAFSTRPPTPRRTVRRRKSDDFAPKGSPTHRLYYIKGKGGRERTQPDATTPGSGSSQGWTDNRKFRRVADPTSGEATTTATRKTRKLKRDSKAARVLTGDDDEASHENPFQTDE